MLTFQVMDAAKLDLCVLLLWNLHAGDLRRPTLYAEKTSVSTFIEKSAENSRVEVKSATNTIALQE